MIHWASSVASFERSQQIKENFAERDVHLCGYAGLKSRKKYIYMYKL